MNLEGKNIIITGGSSGIGEATAISCAMNGARVGIISRTKQRLERVVNNIKDKGGEAEYHVADLVNEEELVSGVESFIEQWGSVQGLVNNAMSISPSPISDQTIDSWKKNFAVTLDAAFLGTKTVLPSMIKNKEGSIVNVSSVVGLRGTSYLAAYGAAKSGLINFTQTSCIEGAPYVRVNCVAPGAVLTPATKEALPTKELIESTINNIHLKRIAEPEEIASVINFLLSSQSSYLTGICIVADGGKTSDLNAGLSME